MKKLLTLFAAGAVAMSASAAVSFSNYTSNPAENETLTELGAITLTFTDFEEVEINDAEGIYMVNGDTYDEVPGSVKVTPYGSNKLVFTPEETITEAGRYMLCIGQEMLAGYYGENYDYMDIPEDMAFYYTVGGSGEETGASFGNYTSDPKENEAQTELGAITLTFTDFEEIEINDAEGIYMVNGDTYDEVPGSVKVTPYGSNKLVFTPEETITEGGNYVLCVGEGMLCGYYGEDYTAIDNAEEMYFTYNVEGTVQTDKFAHTATPESGMSMSELSEVNITFTELSRISILDPALITVTLNQETLESVNYEFADGDNGNELKLTFTPAIVSEGTEIAVAITFGPGALTGVKDGSASNNTEAMELRYLISEPVKYDLTVAFNSPTKPNEDGEISAEKQLTSFFFISDIAGLVPASGDAANVTIREINGDFTKSGHLRKAFGTSQDKSYFSVEFNSEPSYNGEYEIVISQGAFGDEQWFVNPETGHSNMEQTLSFTLVDGADHVNYSIEPVSVTPEETTVDSGEKLAVFTITFDTDVTLAENAHATLAGIDSDYNQSATISASDDNRTFTVNFTTAPTANGKYRFNIGKGAFAGEGDNKSVDIIREYTVDDTVGVNEIGIENGEAEIFNLQGVRVSGKNLPAGIYIVNGKKVKL